MKLQLYPEDMLLEFVESCLNGRFDQPFKYLQHLRHLPQDIEFSEEFAVKWQAMVVPAIKRFIASIFSLRGFLFEADGYTRRCTAADPSFWEGIELRFSSRGAERLYEQMRRWITEEKPTFPLVLPGDALLISICLNDFSLYSYPWLGRNNAGWLIKACHVAWQQVGPLQAPWQCLFDDPAAVELPLRDYLIERAADYIAACNERLEQLFPGALNGHVPRPARWLPLSFDKSKVGLPEFYQYVNGFVASVRKAVAFWCGEGTVCIDDERFIAGAARTYGLDHEFAAFEQAAGSMVENMNNREQIYESLIRN